MGRADSLLESSNGVNISVESTLRRVEVNGKILKKTHDGTVLIHISKQDMIKAGYSAAELNPNGSTQEFELSNGKSVEGNTLRLPKSELDMARKASY